MHYWINVLSKDHALAGVEGGFIQASQGKSPNLRLLNAGDLIFSYSPGTRFRAGELLQAFTAVARVTDDSPSEVESSARAHRWRRQTTPLASEEAPIEPLIPHLDFIKDKAHWTLSVRRGMFEICADDAHRIADAMKADLARLP